MLRLSISIVVGLATWPVERPAPPPRHCALVIPPLQIERAARLEVVYWSPPIGWIVIAGPLACD